MPENIQESMPDWQLEEQHGVQNGKIIPPPTPSSSPSVQQNLSASPVQSQDNVDWMSKLSGFGNKVIDHPAITDDSRSLTGQLPPANLPTIAKPPAIQQAVSSTPQPLQPHQEKALKDVANSHGSQFTSDGLINDQMILNDKAMLQLDNQQRDLAKRAIDDANDHIRVTNAIGAKLSRDSSGSDYWENASTFQKVMRVVGGVLTLGGSEKYINSAIQKKVEQDKNDLMSEDNTYKAMIESGKTKEQAMSIDYAKQSHLYMTGLDIIAARFPSPAVRAKVEALKSGITKEASTAYLKLYDDQNKNYMEQQRINIERAKANAEIGKMSQPNMEKIVRDENGNILGQADTTDEKKQLQAQLSAYKSIDRLGKKVNDYGWGDKFTQSDRALARGLHTEILNQIDAFRNAKPTQENSRVADLLAKMLPDPTDFWTTPDAFKAAYNQIKTILSGQLTSNQLQSGIK